MARNGSGVYTLPSGNPVVTGSIISSTWANTTLNDIASALTNSISTDGQTTPVSSLPMGGYIHTGVGNASLRNQYAVAGQVQDGIYEYLTGVTGEDTIVATAALGMSAYVTGAVYRFIAADDNTGPATLNVNSIGAKNIFKNGTINLVAGDLPAGAAIQVLYDGTQFQLLSLAGTSGATGGGSDQVFIENDKVVTTSYAIPSTKNAMTTGPVTINSGVTITVPTDSRWVIL